MYTCMQLLIVLGSDGSVGYAPRIGFRTQHQKLPPPTMPIPPPFFSLYLATPTVARSRWKMI